MVLCHASPGKGIIAGLCTVEQDRELDIITRDDGGSDRGQSWKTQLVWRKWEGNRRHRGPRAPTDVKTGGRMRLGAGPGPWRGEVQERCVGLAIPWLTHRPSGRRRVAVRVVRTEPVQRRSGRVARPPGLLSLLALSWNPNFRTAWLSPSFPVARDLPQGEKLGSKTHSHGFTAISTCGELVLCFKIFRKINKASHNCWLICFQLTDSRFWTFWLFPLLLLWVHP